MSRSPRREAIQLVGSGEAIAPPPIPGLEPNSPEALNFLERQEPQRFAAFARTIDLLFQEVFDNRGQRPPDGVINATSEVRELTGWQKLAHDMNTTFIADVDAITHTEDFQNSVGFAELFGALNTKRRMQVDRQLYSGAGTGVHTTLTLLRNAPHITRHHEPELSRQDASSVMADPRSRILVRKLSKTGINHMMSAMSALAGDSEYHSWSGIDQVLDPEQFQLERNEAGYTALTYHNFDGLKVPSGYSPHPTVPPVRRETLAADIPSSKGVVIGCPITLLQRRLGELLNWGIELADRRQLWNEDWPIAD